jgi:hypothetical protein
MATAMLRVVARSRSGAYNNVGPPLPSALWIDQTPRIFKEMVVTKNVAVLLPLVLIAAGACAAGLPSAQPKPKSAAGPQYSDKGELQRPTDFRTWVFVGSNIGLGYKKKAPKEKERHPAAGIGDFHNVYINPEAYEHYVKTGKFPDRTMLVMDVYESKERDPQDIVAKGYFPGNQLQIEVAVKNSMRPDSSKTDWAYYVFPANQSTAKAFPDGACYQCHRKHADDDNVWTQFYPTLRMHKKAPAK